MADVKLVAESLQEQEELNESLVDSLRKFVKNPEKNQKSFLKGYSRMYVGKKGGDRTKSTLAKMDLAKKVSIAKGSIAANDEDSNKVYPKIVRGGEGYVGTATVPQGKAGFHGATGQD